jgi:radical SAM protein with 4Fe4S-binding SPASM domain
MAAGVLNLLLGKLPSYTRKRRHAQLLRRYASPRKLLNIARAEVSRLRGDIVVKARPYIYTVDIGNVCNLRCPLCPTGYRGLERPQALMTLETFQNVVDKIRPYAVEVILHNWGEPFLNPHALDMIRYAKANRIGTAVSSNLNLVNRGEEFLEELVESGLDHLTVSLDGTTQEVYQTYRRGGHIEEVLRNMRFILDYRRRTGRSTPQMEWQFLVMKHNQAQIEEARRLSQSMGVDRLRLTGAGLPFNELQNLQLAKEWISELPQYRGYSPEKIVDRGYLYEEECFYLYRAMTVNPLGEVSPCCVLYHQKWDFGNLVASELDEVWNNEHYRASRALFSPKAFEPEVETVCAKCPLFKYESSKARHISAPPAWVTAGDMPPAQAERARPGMSP